jgi:RNA polymerase-binding transcription factor DksA
MRVDQERQRTAAQVNALERDFLAVVASSELTSTDDEHDPEGATIAFERAQVSALLAEARTTLAHLERAAGELRDGTHGRCESCDGPIPLERLMALPSTRRCVGCAAGGRSRSGRP